MNIPSMIRYLSIEETFDTDYPILLKVFFKNKEDAIETEKILLSYYEILVTIYHDRDRSILLDFLDIRTSNSIYSVLKDATQGLDILKQLKKNYFESVIIFLATVDESGQEEILDTQHFLVAKVQVSHFFEKDFGGQFSQN